MKLILASNSPRRRDLLKQANIEFIIKTKDLKEDWKISFSPLSTALSLAYQKGQVIANEFPDQLILSADTIVVLKDKIIGKPKDKKDAKKILRTLSGELHQVITAFSLISIDNSIKKIAYDRSYVKFKKLTDNDIDSYTSTNEPYDKAGAYAIQGEGAKFVDYYQGDFNNIIGLPTEKIISILNSFLKE